MYTLNFVSKTRCNDYCSNEAKNQGNKRHK